MKEWEEDVEVASSDVTGMCGFWDGSCRHWVSIRSVAFFFTGALDWHTVRVKCELVPGGNSLGAEIWTCSMLTVCLMKWVDYCVS